MAFQVTVDTATPPGSAQASTVATELRNLEKAFSERLANVLGVNEADLNTDPIVGALLRLAAAGTTKIIGGTVGLALRNNADSANNILVEDDGDVTIRKDLSLTGKVVTDLTLAEDLTVEAGGVVSLLSPVTVTDAQGVLARKAKGNISGATTVNWAEGNNQAATLTANISLTFSNPVSGAWYMLELKQGGAGSFVVTAWPGDVVWPSGIAPTLTTTAGRTDLISFYYNGTAYIGVVIAQDFNV